MNTEEALARLQEAAEHARLGQHAPASALMESLQAISPSAIAEVCATAFSTTNDSNVLFPFYGFRLLRGSIARDWVVHWQSQKEPLNDFLIQALLQRCDILARPSMKPLLSEVCVSYSTVKKLEYTSTLSLDGATKELDALVLQLSASACGVVVYRTLISSLIEEFGLLQFTTASARSLTMAQHESARRAFQTGPLVNIVYKLFDDASRLENETEETALALLPALFNSLSWRFESTLLLDDDITAMDKIPEVLPIEGPSLKQLFSSSPCQETLLRLFQSFAGARRESEAKQKVVQILVQLCGVRGVDWLPLDRAQFADRCAQVVFAIASEATASYSTGGNGDLVQNCAAAVLRIIESGGCEDGLFANPDLPSRFLQPLLQWTQQVILLLNASKDSLDDEVLVESVDYLLRSWHKMVACGLGDVTVMMKLRGSALETALVEGAATVLRTFIEGKVKCASGFAAAGGDETPDSSHGTEYAQSHTQLIALLGREQPALVARFLSDTLRPLIEALLRELEARRAPSLHLNEALWYVTTIAAHFVADADDSERPCIPNSFLTLAVEWEKRFPNQAIEQENQNEIFSLMRFVLNFAAAVTPHVASGLVSPGVGQAILELLSRYVGTYLMPDEMLHTVLPHVFVTAFEQGVVAADCSLQFCASMMAAFYCDEDVLDSCSKLLSSFGSKPPALGDWLLQQPVYKYFVDVACNGVQGSTFPGTFRGKLFGFLCMVTPSSALQVNVVCPAAATLAPTLEAAAAASTTCVGKVVDAVLTLDGIFSSLRMQEQTNLVFAVIAPLFPVVVESLIHNRVYKQLITAVATLLNTVIVGCGSFLPAQSFFALVDLAATTVGYCGATLRDASQTISQKTQQEASQEEDEVVELLTRAVDLIMSVATWGLLELVDDGNDGITRENCVSNFVVRGLLTVLSLVNSSMLGIPTLRNAVFNLLREVAATYTANFLSVSPAEAGHLLQATEFAVLSQVPDLNRSAYKVMESIATHCRNTQIELPLLTSFIQSILAAFSTGQCHPSTVPGLANALFALVSVCGLDSTLSLAAQVMGSSPLLQRPQTMLRDVLVATDFSSFRRDTRIEFAKAIEQVFGAVKCTRIM